MKKFYLGEFTQDVSRKFFIHYGKHDERMKLHTHGDFTELTIILEGSAVHVVGTEKYKINKGDIFVIGKETIHGFEEAVNFRLCNIMFSMEDFFPSSYDIWKIPGFHALFVIEPYISKDHIFRNHLRLSQEKLSEIEPMIKNMIQVYQQKKEGMWTYLQASFILLALELSKNYKFEANLEDHTYINLSHALSYIEHNYTEQITMEMLANQAKLSLRQFSRLFHQVYKVTPGNYLMEYRLEKATELLYNQNLSVADVAFQCGFNDSNYFSRQFLKHKGQSPREYRKSRFEIRGTD